VKLRNTTRDTIRFALAADPSVSPAQVERLVGLIERPARTAIQAPREDPPVLLKQREAAKLLGVSRQTVRRLRLEGRLTPVVLREGEGEKRPGDLVRYRRSDIEALAEGKQR